MADLKSIRCAVYTRKSSDEGLEQSFNSLHAQREACEAYIVSQKHEGWQLVPTAYDDGGFSGGSMQRPALKALLADLDDGLVDTVVVYKVDRLTRSLADFAKMVERLDAKGASFVSVTQAFNTTTSMGRLTLNVLLSFAQFEREVTGERIRDKIAASKAKGMWMGGGVPLGYDVKDRQLLVNEPEAEQVRQIFALYRRHKTVDVLAGKLAALDIRSKVRATDSGTGGGTVLGRGSLYRILANPIYIGQIAHKGMRYQGQQEAIVPTELFEAVQGILEANRRKKRGSISAAVPAPLAGLVWSQQGERLTSTHTSGAKRYRYYAGQGLRIPAPALEGLAVDALDAHLTSPAKLAGILPQLDLLTASVLKRAARRAAQLTAAAPNILRQLLIELIERVTIGPTLITLDLRLGAIGLEGTAEIVIPATLGRTRARLSLVVPGAKTAAPDAALIGIVAQARYWLEELTSGRRATITALAAAEGLTLPYIRRFIEVAFLAPDLVVRIVEGRQPRSLTVAKLAELLPLPIDWDQQRALVAALD